MAPFDINFKDVIEKVINQDVIRQQKAEELEKCESDQGRLLAQETSRLEANI